MSREKVKPNWNRIAYAYRMTHIDNIPYLLKVGFVHPDSEKASPNYIPIGNQSIIKIREELHHNYKLSDYIPFYFGPHTPMLFNIQTGYNGVTKYPPSDIVFCAIKIETVIEQNWECIFTDGHAVTEITTFFKQDRLPDLDKLVSVDDVYAKYWKDDNDLDLQRRKQAELLIKNEIPAQYIAGFFVYNAESKQKLISMGVADDKILLAPEYYF